MNTADKLALLHPGKKWRVVYGDDGSETVEWNEPGKKPTGKELDEAGKLRPPSLAERVAELESRVAALEKR